MSVPSSHAGPPDSGLAVPVSDPDRTVAGDLSQLAERGPDPIPTLPQMDDAPPPQAQRPAVPGYQILEVLGRGGMGVVYKARQVGLGRHVALKMILSGAHAGPEDMVRFLAEAEAVAQLQHTNIVQIYQIGKHGDVPFFSLEYVEGGNLAQRLNGTPQPPRDAAQLIECLARAMHAAHQKGIVHRDLKPGNILLASGGRKPPDGEQSGDVSPPLADCIPKITDFGLAKRVEGGGGLTQTGAILGTPSYMAPEQAEGKKDVGPTADIYALGALLYEMLTGRPPFHAPTPVETILHVLSDEPVSPTRLQPGCPRDLETICLKCLHKEPGKRYASAEALADDLQRFLTDRPIQARRTGSLERLRRWRRRNPVVAAMTAAVALLLMLLAAGATVAAIWFGYQRDIAERNHQEAVGNLQRAVKAEDEEQEQLWHELVARARAGRFSGRSGQRFDSLNALAQAARMARERNMPAERIDLLRNEAIACLALPDIRTREWDGWPEGSLGLDYNGERDLYARTDQQGNVSVRRLSDDVEVAHLAGEGRKARPHFSPDGRLLLLGEIGGGARILAWRVGEEQPLAVMTEKSPIGPIAISPDAGRFAVAHKGGAVYLYELPTGRRRLVPGRGEVTAMHFRADGRWLAVARQSGAIYLLDLKENRQHTVRVGDREHRLAFQPGGNQLAVCGGFYGDAQRRIVRIFDLETGALAAELRHDDQVESLAWHPNGKILVTGTIDASLLYLWDVPTRRPLQIIRSHKGGALIVHCNSSGDLLVSHSKWNTSLRLWQPHTGKQLLQYPSITLAALRPTSDGRLLCLTVEGRKLRLVEVQPAREHRLLLRDPAQSREDKFHQVAVHPNGRLAAAVTDDGFGLWDLERGDELAFRPVSHTDSVLFDPAGTLMIYGKGPRLQFWPLQTDPAAPNALRLGPPQGHAAPGFAFSMAASRDGRLLACAGERDRGTMVLHRDRMDKPIWLQPQHDVRFVSVSPDGRLVATGNHFRDNRSPTAFIKVWESDTGRLVKALPTPSWSYPCFSPDGRWLATTTSGHDTRLWEVGSWSEVLRRNGLAGAFSPDGKLLTIEKGDGTLQLIEVPSGREVVRLQEPNQVRAGHCAFSSDGTKLLFTSDDDSAVHVWYLRLLRRRLAEMDLDWDADAYPPVKEALSPRERLRVTVDPSWKPPAQPPPVVVLPPDRQRAAKAEEIAAWVKQLGDADAKVRQAAADALAEAGPPAVKALSPIAKGPEGEQRKQARAVLDRIAIGAALAPARVRLQLKDASLADALRAFAKQTGIVVKEPSSTLDGAKPRRLNLKLDDVPAWEALDRICDAAGAHLDTSNLVSPTLSVSYQERPAYAIRGYAGPFRLQCTGGSYQRFVGVLGSGETLNMNLRLLKDPKARSVVVMSLRLTEVQSDDGQSLLRVPNASAFSGGPFEASGVERTNGNVSLKAIDRRGGKIKVLKGVLVLDVMVRPIERVVVPDLAKAKGRTFFGEQGRRLTIVQAQQTGNVWHLLLGAAGPPDWRYEAKRCGFELVDARGRSVQMTNPLFGPYPLQGMQPEDAAWMATSPLAPSLLAAPWAAFAVQSRRPTAGQWQGNFYANSKGRLEAPVRLRFYDCEYLRTEVPFELRDVPLP